MPVGARVVQKDATMGLWSWTVRMAGIATSRLVPEEEMHRQHRAAEWDGRRWAAARGPRETTDRPVGLGACGAGGLVLRFLTLLKEMQRNEKN